jgi:hypothetical protein
MNSIIHFTSQVVHNSFKRTLGNSDRSSISRVPGDTPTPVCGGAIGYERG